MSEVKDVLVVVVTGGRYFKDRSLVFHTLSTLRAECRRCLVIIEGGCLTGADALAREWLKLHKRPEFIEGMTEHADWNRHGRAAGPIRNRKMLEEYEPDLVVAFEGGRGTQSCIDIAKELSITVRKIRAVAC